MKSLKTLFGTALLLAVAAGFSSCSDDDNNEVLIAFESSSVTMDPATNAWDGTYTPACVVYSGFEFSHSYSVWEYPGVTYYSWNGFIPSLSTDNEDRTEQGDWTDHQWGAITGSGVKAGRPYMLAFWDAWGEMSLEQPEEPSLEIKYTLGDKVFKPVSIAVTNSTWGYYGMKNGSYPSLAFTDSSFCYLYINGVKDGKKTGSVKVVLANGTDILKTWQTVDLSSLGEVNSLYFQMESSDSGSYGMNNPAYFCIDEFRVEL